jgi:hypothetical protein
MEVLRQRDLYESFSTIFTPTETALYPTWVIEDLKSNLCVIISWIENQMVSNK